MKDYSDDLALLSWEVEPYGKGSEDTFIVDLRRLAFGLDQPNALVRLKRSNGHSHRPGNAFPSNYLLTLGLAPSIKEWSSACSMRSVKEGLLGIKWLYRFIAEATSTFGIIKPPESFASAEDYVLSLDRGIGVAYAGWLKSIPSTDATRNSRYATAKIFIENATGELYWRANPFVNNPAVLDDFNGVGTISPDQIGALVARCKEILREYKRNRSHVIRLSRRDPAVMASRRATHRSLPNISECPNIHGVDYSKCLLPTFDLACACFLLSIIQLGCNEQPLRDLATKGVWWQHNPFSPDYRLIRLQKNRTGRRTKLYKLAAPPGPKLIKLTVKARPQFQPFKVVRYYDLLAEPLRAACREASVGHSDLKERDHAIKMSNSFWIFLGASGKLMSFVESNLHQLMERFLSKLAKSMPILQNSDGTTVRYSAKAFRDAYFEFTMRKTAFDTPSGQGELSHSQDSTAIRNYMNRVWVKNFARDQYRQFQDSSFAVLRDKDVQFSLTTLKLKADGGGATSEDLRGIIDVPPAYRPNQVRHGYFCTDPKQPPDAIYVPQSADDFCPAKGCWQCKNARCYDQSLPELALDIFMLKRERDECAAHLWAGSEADYQLQSLEDVFMRWPEEKRLNAMAQVSQMASLDGD